MRKYILSALTILLTPFCAQAQNVKSPVALEMVPYSKAFPLALRATIPKNGESRFWGESKLEYQNQKVWVHVYDMQKTDFSAKFDSKDYAPVDFMKDFGDGVQKSRLDLFIQTSKRQWKRISSTQFEYLRFGIMGLDDNGEKPTKAVNEGVAVKTLWLNARLKKQPVIKVDFINSNGIMGLNTLHMLVIFPEGLNANSVAEGIFEGASSLSSWGIDVISTDETGHLLIKTYHPQRRSL